ncbi:Proteasome subunit beta type-7 [Larimichthys crocea]|uniref:Uncharacterized protein n=1 Tax=Larimichthys crocea TaxID=215358 RepID=A0ACD3RG92_LARCR|nr:Proteasome subunit beta type-7 [Larimichthys crocea]
MGWCSEQTRELPPVKWWPTRCVQRSITLLQIYRSGDLAALGILEDGFKPDLELEKAKELVRNAIHAGIMSDLGSGNNIDICVITKQGVDYIRPYQESEYKDNRKMKYRYRPGTTPVLTEKVVPLKLEVVQETVQQMDTA